VSEFRLAHQYRLYPTKAQEAEMVRTLETCRLVYNSLLNWRRHDYETLGKSPSRVDQQSAFPRWKREHPELCDVFSQVLQNVAVRVDLAFDAFFRRVKNGEKPGFPRLKGEGQYDSFTYPQMGFKVGSGSVTLSKIGQVKAHIHRPVEGVVKTCCVRRQNGKWFVCFSCTVDAEALPPSEDAVGIDVGLEKFAALSTGEFIANPRFFRKDEKALAKAQRKFDKVKHKRGSKSRRKAKKVVSRIHERIRNRRHDFVHQTARRIVNRFGVITVEGLNVRGMVRNHCLAKSIADASWSMFRSVLTAKAESAGRLVVAVNPAYTSMTCSGCGDVARKSLSDRWHWCPRCGLSLDRDTNAAVNVLALGQQSLATVVA
jgi:putative transposase